MVIVDDTEIYWGLARLQGGCSVLKEIKGIELGFRLNEGE